MEANTFIAIREPQHSIDHKGELFIEVHHPGDIVRSSMFDSVVSELWSRPKTPRSSDGSLHIGEVAQKIGAWMRATDSYSEGLRLLGSPNPTRTSKSTRELQLWVERTSVYDRLGLHSKAFQDATKALSIDGSNKAALRVACESAIALERYEEALEYAQRLKTLPESQIIRTCSGLTKRARMRADHAAGKLDVNEIVKCARRQIPVADVSTFVGNIEVRKSSLHGRGTFATQDIEAGELLLCERPLTIIEDGDASHGIVGLAGDNVYAPPNGFLLCQRLARNVHAKPEILRKINDLYDGGSLGSNAEIPDVFDR